MSTLEFLSEAFICRRSCDMQHRCFLDSIKVVGGVPGSVGWEVCPGKKSREVSLQKRNSSPLGYVFSGQKEKHAA